MQGSEAGGHQGGFGFAGQGGYGHVHARLQPGFPQGAIPAGGGREVGKEDGLRMRVGRKKGPCLGVAVARQPGAALGREHRNPRGSDRFQAGPPPFDQLLLTPDRRQAADEVNFPMAERGQVKKQEVGRPHGHVVDPPEFQFRNILVEGHHPAAVCGQKAAQEGGQDGRGGIKKDDVVFLGESLGQPRIREAAVVHQGGGAAALDGHVVDGEKPVEAAGQIDCGDQTGKTEPPFFGSDGCCQASASAGDQEPVFLRHPEDPEDGELADAQLRAEFPGGGEGAPTVFAAAQPFHDHVIDFRGTLGRAGHLSRPSCSFGPTRGKKSRSGPVGMD